MGHVKVRISSIEDLLLDAFKFGEKQGGGCNTIFGSCDSVGM
jgi:hypothetical protein